MDTHWEKSKKTGGNAQVGLRQETRSESAGRDGFRYGGRARLSRS